MINYLWDDVKIWDESALKNDGNVGGVEELDGIAAVLSSVTSWFDWQIDTEALQDEHTVGIKNHLNQRNWAWKENTKDEFSLTDLKDIT